MGLLDPPSVTARAIRTGQVSPHPRLARVPRAPGVVTAASIGLTITPAAANAATTLTGTTTRIAPATAKDAYIFTGAHQVPVPPAEYSSYGDGVRSQSLTSPNQSPRGCATFCTDAAAFELFFVAVTSAAFRWRISVDGQQVQLASGGLTADTTIWDGSGSAGGATYRIKLDFGGALARGRKIAVEWLQGRFLGVVRTATSSVWAPDDNPGPRAMWFGDSFTEGTGATWWHDNWLNIGCRTLGWDGESLAVGSTGYFADGGGGGKVKYLDRIATDLPSDWSVPGSARPVDIVGFAGGYNDASALQTGTITDAAYTDLVTQTFLAAKAAAPSADLIVQGPHWPGGVTTSGVPTRLRDCVKAAAIAAGAKLFIDPIGYDPDAAKTMPGWVTGSGKVGATNGTGNADLYTGPDGVHPSQAGHAYLGQRFAAAVIAKAA